MTMMTIVFEDDEATNLGAFDLAYNLPTHLPIYLPTFYFEDTAVEDILLAFLLHR